MILLPFQPKHVEDKGYTARPDGVIDGDCPWELVDRLSFYGLHGPAYTAFVGKTPVAFGGIVGMHPGVGEAWVIVLDHAPTDNHYIGLKAIHAARQFLDAMARDMGLHRLQATMRTDYEAGVRWVKALGFKEEGLMRQYTTDKVDCYRFVRFL